MITARTIQYGQVGNARGTAMAYTQVYDPIAASYLTTRTDITSAAQKNAYNDRVLKLKAASLAATLIDDVPMLAGSDFALALATKLFGTGTQTNANFVSGDWSATLGFKGDGTSKSINTNTANSALTQASFSVSIYVTEAGTSNGADAVFGRAGGAVLGAFVYFVTAYYAFGGAVFKSDNVGNLPYPGILGTWTVTRTSSTSLNFYINGVLIATVTTLDVTAPANPADTGRLFAIINAAGNAVESWSNRKLSIYSAGPGYTIAQARTLAGINNRTNALLGAGNWPVVGPWYFCSFGGGNVQTLKMMQSADGIAWTYLPCTLANEMRDPCFQPINGTWFVCYTTSLIVGMDFTNSTSFGIASCAPYTGDFLALATVDCSSITGVQFVWGPKYDLASYPGEQHIVVCCSIDPSAVAGFKMYDVQALNIEQTSWTAPVEITGTGFPSSLYDAYRFINPNDPGAYYICVVDISGGGGTQGIIILRSTTSPIAGYTIWQDKATHNSGVREACDIAYLGGNSFREYAVELDSHTQKQYRDSTDNMATWGAWADITAPTNTDNGVVIKDATIAP